MTRVVWSLLHFVACALYLAWCVRRIRRLRTLTLFHLTSCTYVLFALLCYPFISSDPWAIVTPETIRGGCCMALIFLSGCFATDLLFYRRASPSVRAELRPTPNSLLILTGIFLAGFVGFLRFFFDAGAVRYVGNVLIAVRAGAEYYDAREAIAAVLVSQTGKGVAHGTTAVYITVPVVVALGCYFFRAHQRSTYLLLALAAAVQGWLTVLVFMERAPMLFAATFPIVAWLAARLRLRDARRLLRRHLRLFLLGGAAFVLLGLTVYRWTDSESNPLEALYSRIFMSPCITANYYLAAFPEAFPFRGWSHIFSMGATLGGDDVGTRDIASFVTGGLYFYNPNSGILPTAYSGAGLPGCAVTTLVYLLLVVPVDRAFRRFPAEIRTLNLLVNLYSLPMLANAPLLAAISSGFVLPSFLLLLFLFSCRRASPQPTSASAAATPSLA